MPLTTLAKVKAALNIPTAVTQHDDQLNDIMDEVDAEMVNWVGVTALTVNDYAETHDIDRLTSELRLKEWPVVSVTAMTESGSLVSSDDYYVDNEVGYIRFIDTTRFFNQGRQKVQVSYSAGHVTTSGRGKSLVRAATLWTCSHFNTDRHEGMDQETIGTYSVKRSKGDELIMPRRVLSILQGFIRVT